MSNWKDGVAIIIDGESSEFKKSSSHPSEDFEIAVDIGAWNLGDVNLRVDI